MMDTSHAFGRPDILAGVSQDSAADLDRMTATVMFTDIEDSTGLAGLLGVTGIARFLRRHCALIGGVVRVHQGRLLGCTGDGVVAFWSDALPHHTGAARCALAAAADLCRRISDENICRQAAGLPTRRVRIGLHSGEVALERPCVEGSLPQLYGATAHVARRVEQAGKMVGAPGEEVIVMASQETLRLAAFDVAEVRGVVHPWASCGLHCAARPGLSGCDATARCLATHPVHIDPRAIS